MQVLGKLWKMLENIEILNFPHQKKRRNYSVSEPNFHTTKFFTENLLAMEMKKTEILMNKPVHLGLSTLELSTILFNEFRHDYEKPKYGDKVKFYNMDTVRYAVRALKYFDDHVLYTGISKVQKD